VKHTSWIIASLGFVLLPTGALLPARELEAQRAEYSIIGKLTGAPRVLQQRGGGDLQILLEGAEEASFVPEKPVMLFTQIALGGGTTVRATYDVAPDGRFLLNQSIPQSAGERDKKIFPSALRIVLNWTDEAKRLLDASH